MVALTSPDTAPVAQASPRGARWRWSAATGAVLVLGIGLRLALQTGAAGDRSAAVMIALLGVSAWAAALLLATPRLAFLLTLVLVALLDLAALPARTIAEYDDRQAFYQTDQVLAAHVSIPPGVRVSQTSPALTLLVEPTFTGARPQFGLAGDVGGAPFSWDCAFRPGIQRLALAVPTSALADAASLDIRLHLTGSPTRDSDYLLVYASSAHGGFLVSLVSVADLAEGGTICALQ